tara:strand:+ start:14182 stop:15066 length:885 start_codon:yes stop_codon:yes gene_type:complete
MIETLWIDDQWKLQEDFIGEAEQFGINIYPFDNGEDGMKELKEKKDFYHSVILDAKVKLSHDSEKIGLEGLTYSRDILITINEHKYMPYFILTGQPDYMETNMFREAYGEFYTKGDDNSLLFNAIIDSAKKHSEIQARTDFPESFNCFDLGILSTKSKSLYINMLSSFRQDDFKKANLNDQRDLLESLFLDLHDPIPCIPLFCFPNGRPNQEWCTRFLEGYETSNFMGASAKLDKNIPRNIQATFRKIKESTNGYSHLTEDEIVKTPFIANIYGFVEILEWLPKFVEVNYKNYI